MWHGSSIHYLGLIGKIDIEIQLPVRGIEYQIIIIGRNESFLITVPDVFLVIRIIPGRFKSGIISPVQNINPDSITFDELNKFIRPRSRAQGK